MSKKIVIVKSNSIIDLLIHIGIIICLFIVTFIFFFATYLPFITNHGESVVVPEVVGLDLERTKELLDSKDLEFIIKDSVFSKTQKPNTVLSQFPEPGARIKQSRKIYIVINPLVPPKIKMPELIDKTFDIAVRELRNNDLELGKIKYIPHVSSNKVLEQTFNGAKIPKGQMIMKGSKIDLVLSDGVGQTEFEVPELVGLSLSEAETVIKGSDLLAGQYNYINDSDEPIGTIIRQNPEPYAGTKQEEDGSDDRIRNKIRTGQIIDLWISGTPVPKPKQRFIFDDVDEYKEKPIKDTLRKGNVRKEKDIQRIQNKKMGIKEETQKDKPKKKDKEQNTEKKKEQPKSEPKKTDAEPKQEPK